MNKLGSLLMTTALMFGGMGSNYPVGDYSSRRDRDIHSNCKLTGGRANPVKKAKNKQASNSRKRNRK